MAYLLYVGWGIHCDNSKQAYIIHWLDHPHCLNPLTPSPNHLKLLQCIYTMRILSITLPYPFTSHLPFSTAFNIYPYILYLHQSYVLWYCWCFVILFFPSFPESHRVVLLLQTWTDKSKEYLQWGYIEKSLWKSAYILIMKGRTIK
jgi:hypothetical protein